VCTARTSAGENVEAQLNSRSGRIQLFPVAPAAETIALRNFQARGGFLVSACKNSGGVYHLEIEARRNRECRLMNPWPASRVIVREAGTTTRPTPSHLETGNGECIVFSALAVRKYLVSRAS
jgi:hypothetical protein